MPPSTENFEGYYIGVMTGTSGDGLDIALVNINRSQGLQFVSSETIPFNTQLRQKLIELSTPSANEIEKLGQCDTELGNFIGRSILSFLESRNLSTKRILSLIHI